MPRLTDHIRSLWVAWMHRFERKMLAMEYYSSAKTHTVTAAQHNFGQLRSIETRLMHGSCIQGARLFGAGGLRLLS